MTHGATPRKLSTAQQISKMMTLLKELPKDKATPELFKEVCAWIVDLPPSQRPEVISNVVALAFGRPVEEIDLILKPFGKRSEFDLLIPKEGWIRDYIEWTRDTEPPTVFHYFVAATAIGAALGRGTLFDKGAYQVFPNLCIVIVAPTGRCRKTSACNMGIKLFVKTGGTLLADKTTPEALVDALKTQPNATALLYAPELAVFLGKQKYQEGMVPLLTSLFDCPEEWTSKTIGRGDTVLTNVALSALMCSTLDWIQSGISRDAFGGGFMSRFLFVVQESTPRCFALPPTLDETMKKDLQGRLTRLRLARGRFTMTDEAREWYEKWYASRPVSHGDKQYAGYYERKPDHIIRLAMIDVIARAKPLVLHTADLQQAERILLWLETWLPSTFEEMTASHYGEDQARVLRQLRQLGGACEHSRLLRKNSSRINADQFKRAMATLREAKLVEWDAAGRTYHLTAEGWT